MSKRLNLLFIGAAFCLLGACASVPQVDVLITGGRVFDGTDSPARPLDIGICGEQICWVQPQGRTEVAAKRVINAQGLIVSPGFIDPHTHSLEELSSEDYHANLNYLFQGVTTVVNGNDGGGPADIPAALAQLNPAGIGTNLALFAGHGSLRRAVMGNAKRDATEQELAQMTALMEQAMQQGALGLSSGLYYVPGSFAPTSEVVELAKVAAEYGGIYDTHLRDESTFNIGFLAALDEAIEIAGKSGIHLHLAHIKALGVDVWGQSQPAIDKIQQAQAKGVSISADQYPWQASGTFLRSAVVPKWTMAGSDQDLQTRLNDPHLRERLIGEINENIRRRGGPDALLITASEQQELIGKTLEHLAEDYGLAAAELVIELVKQGRTRVASFNMSLDDIHAFMQQPWVVTSSDGTNGHPRKFASFPKKYREYVQEKNLISLQRFIHGSTGQTAAILGLTDRGELKEGRAADILVFDPKTFRDQASFGEWNKLSSGVEYLLVNGSLIIDQQTYTGELAGKFIQPQK